MDNPLQKFQNELNEALKIVPEGRLAGKGDDDLRQAVITLQKYLSGQSHPPPLIQASIDAMENELARRQKDKHQEDSKILHYSAMEQGKDFHGETMEELEKLKQSVDRLANPHWVLWATLVATAIAAIAGVILLFR